MKIKFIKPSYEIDMKGQSGIKKLKHVEKVARTCYKSEDKITDDSWERMIRMLVKNGHTAMLEHLSHHFEFIYDNDNEKQQILDNILQIKSNTVGLEFSITHTSVIITCNARTIRDAKVRVNNKLANDLITEASKECEILYLDLMTK